MNLIEEAYQRLYPQQEFNYQTELEYNRRLKDFNANVRFTKTKISINLNLQWKDIDEEIKIGLIQTLLQKVFKRRKKVNSQNIELYNNFIKNIPILTPKTKSHPFLEESFKRVNEQFFNNQLEQPNLTWGMASKRKLASYNFHDDTITVSTIFRETEEQIIDYLMYHELLHKDQKFYNKNGRSFFHTPKFKEAENLYPHRQEIERQIHQIIRKSKTKQKKNSFWDFF